MMMLFSLLLQVGSLLAFNAPVPPPPAEDPIEEATLYISTDHSENWVPFTKGLHEDVTGLNIFEVADRLYLSTRGSGLYVKDTKAMDSPWQKMSIPDHVWVNSIVEHHGRLIAGSYSSGIYISDNGGKSWRRPPLNLNRPMRCLYTFDNTLIALTDNGLFQSPDQGESWIRYSNDLGINMVVEHRGKLIVAGLRKLGVLKNGRVEWAEKEFDYQVRKIKSEDGFLYLYASDEKTRRSYDGFDMKVGKTTDAEVPTGSLNEMRYFGFEPQMPLPKVNRSLNIKETSLGWFLINGGSGC